MSESVAPGTGRNSGGGSPGERAAGALDRGLAILTHVAGNRGVSTPEIAQALGLTRSTAYRLVDRLEEQGWLTHTPAAGQWQLGPTAVRLASAAVTSTNLRDTAAPALRKLAELTQETVSLGVPNGLTMVFVHRERGTRPAVVTAEPGASRPLHSSSLGRAYLAALPPQKLEDTLIELVRDPTSPVSAATVSEVHAEVERTRERGWAQDLRDFDESSCCCGAAVYDHTGMPVACISVAGVAERMAPLVPTYGPVVAQVCRELSSALGYVPPGAQGASAASRPEVNDPL
ncbi:IclR family transcriptional regulator [Streptomyces platensis]|uniref:HTH-type transcriptional repressor AllR n=1 Tax=Streptomyces platensis TaxID=58346 RepID=A0AAE6NFE7_STRPT|nr:IclR family transcriptional regulator [Streptomyces platensis]OSY46829.1 HTH-type transcriptional repressor AllR [Streptomyces platensis]QEV50795.1 IclR family transcriptional regulator [Streptomyces platensis]